MDQGGIYYHPNLGDTTTVGLPVVGNISNGTDTTWTVVPPPAATVNPVFVTVCPPRESWMSDADYERFCRQSEAKETD